MAKESKPATILDVSKGLGYGFMYNPVIGKAERSQYPFVFRIRPAYRSGRKKGL